MSSFDKWLSEVERHLPSVTLPIDLPVFLAAAGSPNALCLGEDRCLGAPMKQVLTSWNAVMLVADLRDGEEDEPDLVAYNFRYVVTDMIQYELLAAWLNAATFALEMDEEVV